MYVVNSFNVCGKSVSVLLTSTVYTVNPRFAFIRGGRFILSFIVAPIIFRGQLFTRFRGQIFTRVTLAIASEPLILLTLQGFLKNLQ